MAKINLEAELPKVIDWVRQTVGGCNVVIGISGGKDSSVVAALCVKALGKDKVFGVMMPNRVQDDIDKSELLIKTLGIKSARINIGDTVDALTNDTCSSMGIEKKDLNLLFTSNTPARIRMATLYGVAAIIGNARVANTCNLSEDYVGYCTKFGDAAGDFSPLSRFTATEVMEIGDMLGLPSQLSHKVPTDGMCGLTDEDRFGFTYAELDAYLRDGVKPSPEKLEKIERMHRAGLHKLLPMPCYEIKK